MGFLGGGGGNGSRQINAQLAAEQKAAAAAALPVSPEQEDLRKQFSFSPGPSGILAGQKPGAPGKLLKYTRGEGDNLPSFEFQQGEAVFGFGTFKSQEEAARKFDPSKPFDILRGDKTPQIVQGDLKFTIPNPVAIRKQDAVVAATSPNAAAEQPLPRLPRFGAGGTGSLAQSAASRSVSNVGVNRRRDSNLIRPMLAGY